LAIASLALLASAEHTGLRSRRRFGLATFTWTSQRIGSAPSRIVRRRGYGVLAITLVALHRVDYGHQLSPEAY
jgi:hypothetical protein